MAKSGLMSRVTINKITVQVKCSDSYLSVQHMYCNVQDRGWSIAKVPVFRFSPLDIGATISLSAKDDVHKIIEHSDPRFNS